MFVKTITIKVFDPPLEEGQQAKYLVIGESDVLWTDILEDAICFVRSELVKGEEDV